MAYPTCKLRRTKFVSFVIGLAIGIGLASSVFAQALPWQTQGAPAPQPLLAPQYPSQNPPRHQHHYQNSQAPAASNGSRAEDDRQLNLLATKFYGITAKDPDVIPKLKRLEGEVRAYRADLANRGVDHTDIASDAKKLQGRIAHQRKELEEKAAAAAAPATASPVQSVPPAVAVAPNDAPSAPAPAPHPPVNDLSPVAPLHSR